MSRTSQQRDENEGVASTASERKSVAKALRELIRSYVQGGHRRGFAAEAHSQSQLVAGSPDELEVMNWICHVSDDNS